MDPLLNILGVPVVNMAGRGGGLAAGDFGQTLAVTDCTTRWTKAGIPYPRKRKKYTWLLLKARKESPISCNTGQFVQPS